MKVLVIQPKIGMGDMVIYLPYIHAISKKYQTPVSILVKENSRANQLLAEDRHIDEIILFPSNISLDYFSRIIGKFKLGIQDLDHRNEGQGTGSIAASQVKNLCDYSLIGHSERRQNFFENDEIISRKINISQKNNITPVLCVGEDLDLSLIHI